MTSDTAVRCSVDLVKIIGLTRVQFQLVFSDVECFVQSQISGVVFTCNYLGFNVLSVVMISYEVFFPRRFVVGQMFFHAIV